MTLAISATKTRYRFDSPYRPKFTPSGITNLGRIQVAEDSYVSAVNSVQQFYSPKNETDTKQVVLKNVFRPSWTLTNATLVSSDPKKSSDGSLGGAQIGSITSPFSIEGTAVATNKKCGICLTDTTDSHPYDESNEHCLILQADGYACVYELGEKIYYTETKYSIGDKPLITLDGNIVKYFLVRSGEMVLLRTTRLKTITTLATRIIYGSPDAQLTNAVIYTGEKISLTLEVFGVLDYLQSWQDDFQIQSTAESVTLQDKRQEFTFSNSKKRLRGASVSRQVMPKEKRAELVKFFEYHGIEKDFLFVDKARTDEEGKPTEFWARFTSALGDKMRASCLSINNAQIIESFRKDRIILDVDVTNPNPIVLDSDVTGNQIQYNWTQGVDDSGEIDYYELEVSYQRQIS